MELKPFLRLRIALILVGTLSLLFIGTSNTSAQTPLQPLYAMKTLYTTGNMPPGNGYFYVPNIPPPPPAYLKIEMLFNNTKLTGDQTGGVSGGSPYTTITHWPDRRVNMFDLGFIAGAFGSVPGSPRWNYLADVVPDKKINMLDIAVAAGHFGGTGTYMSWPQPGVTVSFDGGPPQTPDSSGFVPIPQLAKGFTVYQNGVPTGTMVTFWSAHP